MSDRFDPATTRRILARAAELDGGSIDERIGYERSAIEEAAAEVGISPAAVRRALAEHTTGALTTPTPSRNLLGPATVRVAGTVGRPAAVVRRSLDRWLKAQTLSVARRRDTSTTWRRRDDTWAKLRRRLDFSKTVRLASIDEVTVAVTAAGDGVTNVCFDVDLSNTRRGLWTGAVALPTALTPLAGAAVASLTGDLVFLGLGLPAGALLGGAGFVVGRRTLADGREEVTRVLELALDDLDTQRG